MPNRLTRKNLELIKTCGMHDGHLLSKSTNTSLYNTIIVLLKYGISEGVPSNNEIQKPMVRLKHLRMTLKLSNLYKLKLF